MPLSRRRLLELTGAAALLPAMPHVARAQAYPNHPVRIIVGQAAGSASDIVARLFAQWLSERLGQQFIVEARPGAAGNIATEAVTHMAPDGYNLLLLNSQNAINVALYEKLNFDFARDIVPVGKVEDVPLVMEVNPSIPAKTVAEFIAYAKANPGKLTFASAGVGSGIHLAAEYFRFQAGIEMTHVPYKGSAPALSDLVGGHVSMYFSSLPPAVALVKDGKLRALAVTGLQRSPIFPDLPTIAEVALPGFEAVLHYGIVAPAGTPKPIVEKLNAALQQAVTSDDMKRKLAADGTEPLTSTPEEYAADIDKEETKWSAIIKKSGAKAQ
jgi:tripartite-type tricarboxylate transporter receptor subunit TctC